ncbi:hypothetical protein [Streptomyces sp. TRM68416]|uniref:hypothetical protein n=1 Tax=Streptomyces sp. TRM68416 TaxID=2758412 RepID=UPI00166209AE|nr:hypothetical protein [Streptomyces sp. TRM68416]MBD0844222.1 hypothetical protein [Streptomyces sp. TRM68416]
MTTNLDPTTAARRAGGWVIGTFHGGHDGTHVVAIATRDDSAPLPYGWECSCGIGQRFADEGGMRASAWRHVHPPRWRAWARRAPILRRLVQPTARLQHSRTA